MPKNPKEPVQIQTSLGDRERHAKPILALALLTLALLVGVALMDLYFDPLNNPHVTSDITNSGNRVGVFGDEVAYWLFYGIGSVAWCVPVLLLRFAFLSIYQKAEHLKWSRLFAVIPFILALCGWGALYDALEAEDASAPAMHFIEQSYQTTAYYAGTGGKVGVMIYGPRDPEKLGLMKGAVGPFGSGLLYTMTLIAVFIPLFFSEPSHFFSRFKERMTLGWINWISGYKKRAAARKELREAEREARKLALEEAVAEKKKAAQENALRKATEPTNPRKETASATASKKPKDTGNAIDDTEDFYVESPEQPIGSPDEAFAPKAVPQEPVKPTPPVAEPRPAQSGSSADLKIIQGEEIEKAEGHLVERKGEYYFPGLDLLAQTPQKVQTGEDYGATATSLVRTLSQFKVEVELGEIHSGPVITRYEVIPAPGVRVNKIETLDKDLALGLKAQSVRILAPVPGKGTVGIEVPNQKPAAVFLRDIIESRAWADSEAEIPIVLGKEVTGKPVVIDLTKMPHMLIAGSTGSGKSVCINTVIASLLYKLSPDDLRFIMVDPKMVELKMYNDLPHMLVPVVTEAKKVPGALKYLIKEMEYRFQVFSEIGVRNIAGFNAKILKDKAARDKASAMDAVLSPEERHALNSVEVPRDRELELPTEKLPYIVCIIDELADLMMVAPADIEHCIMRLTQLARAAGIHLILATQRPSVNVITGVIKANIPTRIAFKVASNTDSRTILDSKGAEALIGKGDMLFTPPGSMSLVRAQGAFVSDDEISSIVEFVHSRNGDPVFDETVQRQIEAEGEDDDGKGGNDAAGDWDDPLVKDAIEVIRASQRASTSMLQRRLKIGYNRAARIMELLEEEGIVGPENGSSPREILKELDNL